jgi:hypothetical protein
MKPSFSLFINYGKNLAKKWILWLFLALDSIAIIVQFFIPTLRFPQLIYILILVIGLIWAGFQTYLDLLQKIPSEARPIEPDVNIYFNEGNEYSYRFQRIEEVYSSGVLKLNSKKQREKLEKEFHEQVLPKAFIDINFRIENKGLVSVDVISVNGSFESKLPYHFMVPNISYQNNLPITYPIKLDPTNVVQLCSIDYIFTMYLTEAQVAANTRILFNENAMIETDISIEVIDSDGKIYKFRSQMKVSVIPLCNMYLSHWKNIGRNDLVTLATGNK